ncbi:hypothetical protein SPPN_00990 [Streptococcus pseudopneumoniae IS7493]|nr:hypothetical protein SPPN_00990 [Streptococcus pseudopneumoniae IS7493]
MTNLKKCIALGLGVACLLPLASQTVSARMVYFDLHVTREDYSVSSRKTEKTDGSPAVANTGLKYHRWSWLGKKGQNSRLDCC